MQLRVDAQTTHRGIGWWQRKPFDVIEVLAFANLPHPWKFMTNLRIALYQPDIPGNTGTILRLAACLGLAVDVIEPAGFDLSDRNLRRAGMDYVASVTLTRHVNWERFEAWRAETGRRLVLASTKAAEPYTRFGFRPDDILLFGRESAGVPDHVHERADARILIPMAPRQRSLNIAMAAAMIVGEAMRQVEAF
ncbi:tRNA (cytidine(34)-2'-O)-methyltransferase [Sinorhizobium alkalisoli]|nr:tRNA (cytidine(34)-2'-O)-methyltransferase [Sinorhizobium alkalisoli]